MGVARHLLAALSAALAAAAGARAALLLEHDRAELLPRLRCDSPRELLGCFRVRFQYNLLVVG